MKPHLIIKFSLDKELASVGKTQGMSKKSSGDQVTECKCFHDQGLGFKPQVPSAAGLSLCLSLTSFFLPLYLLLPYQFLPVSNI